MSEQQEIIIKGYVFTIIKADNDEDELFLRLEADQVQNLYLEVLSELTENLPVNVFGETRTYLGLQYHLFNKVKSISEITLCGWIELDEWKRNNNIPIV